MSDSNTENHTEPTRQALASVIRAFLNSESMAFEFDEQLDAFCDSSDPVIEYVVDAVWYHYDDCDDHLVCLSKQQWDFFQRLLLLLASDCVVETESRRIWSLRQVIAATSLAVFTYFAVQAGWGYHLLLLAVPFGAISMLLSQTRPAPPVESDPYLPIIFPFESLSDLARTYRSSLFRKTQYPKSLSNRQIRSPDRVAFEHFLSQVMWLLLSPFPLFAQCFPHFETDVRVKATS